MYIYKSKKNKFLSSTCLLKDIEKKNIEKKNKKNNNIKTIKKHKNIEKKIASVNEKKTLHRKEIGEKLKTIYLKKMITLLFKYKQDSKKVSVKF